MKSAHKESGGDLTRAQHVDAHPPTMVALDPSALPLAPRSEHVTATQSTTQADTARPQPSVDDEPEQSSPEHPSEGEDDEAFDISASESENEGTSEEEQPVNKERSSPNAPRPATSEAPASAAHHGPLPRVRPIPRVSATPQPFIPPPLPPGLHAQAELMAFTQELFNVVGRFQS